MPKLLKSFGPADVLLILVATIWGINVAVVKSALTEFNPLTFNSLRFGISALLSWLVLGLSRAKALPDRKDLPGVILLGLLGHTLYQILFILGTNLTTVANTALLLATIPVWVAALGAVTKEEVAGLFTWLGIGISLLGIALVTAKGDISLGGGTWRGDTLLIVGTCFYGAYTLKSRNLLRKYSPVQFSTWATTAGALGMAVVSWGQIRAQDWSKVGTVGWGGLAFSAGLAITLGYFIWSNGIKRLGSARTALYNNLTPVTALIYSAIFTQEKITLPQLAGALLIIGGLSLARWKKLQLRGLSMHKNDIEENYHGTLVADPYRWLEDSLSPETQAWAQAENVKTRAFLDIPLRREVYSQLARLWDYPKYELPQEAGERLFFQKNDGLQNQAILYCQEAGKEPIPVLDPNTFSTDGTVALTSLGFSPDGKLLAHATSTGGSDWQKIRILQVDTGQEYPETINWCRFTNLPWDPDGKGFYYSRYPEPGSVPPEDQSNYSQVWYHRLGSEQTEDLLVYERPDAKELSFSPFISEDKEYLGLVVTYGTSSCNRFYLRPLASEGDFLRLLDEGDAAYWPIGNIGALFYFNTNLVAPRGRIIAIDIQQPARENWVEIIPQAEDTIADAHLAGGRLVVTYMHHACHRVKVFNPQGKEQGDLALPGLGSVTGLRGKFKSDKVYLGFMSFLYPPSVFQCDLESRTLVPFGQASLSFVPQDYETKQIFYPSKDGTQVPMFLTYKKGLINGNNPTILYGYGGFNISMTPTFSPTNLLFIQRGGIYAVANLRGGSEYGEDWHRAGMLENKQNVFDDFIAAAQWLVDNRYTRRERLAILGRSNGGLLTAACMTQRPDLFGAVISWVPVIDMLRYHKFTVGRFWIPEYGDAETNPEHFKFMYAYSPLHNIREGIEYPPTLVMTADTDDRVIPGHALKFAATLKEKYKGDNPIYLRLETKAGHGPGKPISKLIDEAADYLTFLYRTIGL